MLNVFDFDTATAYNERFCVIAAVSPQIMQWKLASYYPAGSSVEAATTQSRHHVSGQAESANVKRKDMKRLILILLLSWTMALVGQNYINVETDKFPGVEKMAVESFNSCCAKKGFHAIYYFDEKGNPIKSLSFFEKEHRCTYEYKFNEMGLLIEKTQTFSINRKGEIETTKFFYEFDSIGRVIRRTTDFCVENSARIKTDIYQDFNIFGTPQTIITEFGKLSWTIKKDYNSNNQAILIQRIQNDTIIISEECRYNEHGNLIYCQPKYLKENAKLLGRHLKNESGEYKYEYKYDKLNRWIEKYSVSGRKKLLLEKRTFYDRKKN